MKKLSIIISLILLNFSVSNAQKEAGDYINGTITTAEGDSMSCYLEYYDINPGLFQNGVKYITNETFDVLTNGGKIKGKDINKFSPKNVTKIVLSNGKVYEPRVYADLTAVGTASIPKTMLFELVVDGRIKVYKKYRKIGGLTVVSGQEAYDVIEGQGPSEQEKIQRNNSTFEILVIKDTKNAQSISNIKLDDYIMDVVTVYDKYKNDEYGDLQKVLSSKIKSESFNDNHPKYAKDFIRIIKDYNTYSVD